ncbi:MAG: adenylate/guanylate cyclase domain-containing protein, partial [Chloroflexota bacterium]
MPALVDTLASYVPALITRRLAADPTPLTGPIAEQLPAAIMFADITGFTPLAERLAQRGPAGTEELGRLLNAYFGQLIDLVTAHGGDVVKFAGDGLMAMWTTTDDEPLSHATRRAAQCALAAQAALHNYQLASDVRFTMRIGIGAGDVFAVHLGGVFQRWVFLLSGAPLAQVSAAEQQARPGQVILSPEATQLIRDDCALNVLPDGSAQLEAVRAMLAPRPLASIPLSAEMESALRAYIPIALLARVTAGQSQWLAELRRVTVLFINLPDLDYRTPLAQAQTILRELQNALYHYEGSIDDLGVDDKGVSLIVALGLPPLAHEDDAARGIAAARAMQAKLRALGVRSAIGVTTGRFFCGTIGNVTRSSYNMVGDDVNLASRLMQAARDDILCDANTYLAARDHVTFDALPPIAVKGKAERVAVYRPVSDSATKLQSGEQPQTAIVGRAPERAALEARLQALLQRESGVVVIEGEAGIGKSQLVEATRR